MRGTTTTHTRRGRRLPLRVATAASMAAVLALGACAKDSGSSSGGDTLKLGMIVAETGPIAGAGKTFANGARIAAQEINDGDLIGGGKKIELVAKEGSEDPAKSASVVAQLAADKDVVGITCCILSTVAGAAKPIANKQKVPLMLWGATDVNLAEPPYVYRTVTMPQPANEKLAQTVAQQKKLTSVAYGVMTDNSGIVSQAAAFKKGMDAAGVKNLGQVGTLSTQTNFTSAATSLVGATVVRGADPFVVLGTRFEEQVHPGGDEPLYTQLLENLGFPHSLIVNRAGARFGDESYYGALIRGLRTFDPRSKEWSNFPCWLVFDESFHRNYPLGPYPPGAPYPAEVLTFDTLDELATKVGIDADGLAASVERFNGFAAGGEDIDFARGSLPFAQKAYGDPRYPNPNLGPIATGPFHAVPLHVLGVGLCSLGLAIDTDARVLRRDGTAIDGLFATGNAAATRELKGYVTGLANARNYTYAYRAVNEMFAER